MRDRRTLGCLILLVPLLWACGRAERAGDSQPSQQSGSAEQPASGAGDTPEPPRQVAGTGSAERGRVHYETLCSSCHGMAGDGDGPVGQSLDPKPRKHSDGRYMNALSDEHLFLVIKQGGPAVGMSALMAPWGGSLSDDQIRDVIAFVRTLAKPPYPGGQP